MDKKGNIFVVYYKPGDIINSDIYIPIQAGKSISRFDLGILSDNTGDNISSKNSHYCEFTAMYRVRKNYNISDLNYIGFCHYRRFLSNKLKYYFQELFVKSTIHFMTLIFGAKTITWLNSLIKFINRKKNKNNKDIIDNKNCHYEDKEILQDKEIKKYLKQFDFIIAKKRKNRYNLSIEKEYYMSHRKQDFLEMKKIICEKHKLDIKNIDTIFEDKKQYAYNIYITSPKEFNKYMNWLFDILFELEKKIPSSQDKQQQRALGFLGERMFHLYIRINNFKVIEMPLKYRQNEF